MIDVTSSEEEGGAVMIPTLWQTDIRILYINYLVLKRLRKYVTLNEIIIPVKLLNDKK